METKLLLITPVFNEAEHLERVIAAVANQTRPPDAWVIADDGSTDGTLAILQRHEAQLDFLHVLTRPPDTGAEPDRLAVALEAAAFNRGLALAAEAGFGTFTHVGKLDGDIELPPHYLASLLERFGAEPELGLAGGRLIEPHASGWRRLEIPDHHVHGALKLYSRACFERIGGIQPRLGWDTIDETYARMAGFKTRSYEDLVAKHLRPAASADGQLRGRARHGECAWILHYSAPWVLMRSAKVALDPPRVLSGFAFLYGYARAAVTRVPRVNDDAFRRFTRAELRLRLRAALTG